jgi:nucleotide-binding universal stress UspA family protein
MARILVGYDGTEAGKAALERAIEEARSTHDKITVLSVVNMPLEPDAPRNFGTLDDIAPGEGAPLSAPPDVVEHLREARGILGESGLDADLMWAAGNPAHEIVESAKQIKARVIVIGRHHHGLLSDLMGGDVDTNVRHEAGCEVILA